MAIIQDSRIRIKRSTVNGDVPTQAPDNDHTGGEWDDLDIYVGELYMNAQDERLWIRSISGIIEIPIGKTGHSSESIYFFKKDITSAQVLSLNSTPLEVVSAPGSGKAIELLSASIKMVYNSATYSSNTILQLFIDTAADNQWNTTDGGLLASTTDCWGMFIQNFHSTDDVAFVENKSLKIRVASGDPTTGDSDITIYGSYRLIEV